MTDLLQQLADGERDQLHITAIKVIQLKEHGIQSLVKVETDGGIYGLGEIGAPAAVARAYIETMNADGIQVTNGKLKVPDKPGLGITLVDEVLRANLWEGERYWDE